MDNISNKKLIFLGSFVGYLITAIALVVGMEFQSNSFKLAGILIIPFAISSFLVCRWYSAKIIGASTLRKTIRHSLSAATFTSLLSGFFAGVMAASIALYEATNRLNQSNPASLLGMVGIYMVVGLIYSIPGILVAGIGLGIIIHRRRLIKTSC